LCSICEESDVLEILQFIFSSFWVFLGTVILLGIVTKLVAILVLGLAAIIRKSPLKIE